MASAGHRRVGVSYPGAGRFLSFHSPLHGLVTCFHGPLARVDGTQEVMLLLRSADLWVIALALLCMTLLAMVKGFEAMTVLLGIGFGVAAFFAMRMGKTPKR